MEGKEKKKHKVAESKIKNVKEIASLIDKYNTTVIASTLNLSSAQLQKVRKALRGKAEVKFAKKSTALIALEESKKEGVKKLKEHVNESPALLFTQEDPFDLAVTLADNKFPSRAKAGQISPKEIKLEAGPTDLLPGPILSELGAAGIKAGMVSGKIAIKEEKILVKEGQKISVSSADILMKLDISPFEVALSAQAAFDSKSNKIYSGIKIDKQKYLSDLQQTFATAYQFAIYIGYPSQEVIGQIIMKAAREANALDSLIASSQPAPAVEEPKAEEPQAQGQPESLLPDQNTQTEEK